MSILARLVARLGLLRKPRQHVPNPDCLALRDWADLPRQHPRCL